MPTSLTYSWMILLSFVPKRYRAKSSLEGSRELLVAAGLSGFLQAIIFSFLFIAAFINQATGIWEAISGVVLESEKGPLMDPVQVRLTTGVLGVTTFLLRPTNLLFAYLAAEGSVRAFGAFALSHIVPTLPLYLISALHDRLGARARRKKFATLAGDVIEPARDSTYDLHVLSSRRKQEWSPFIGIDLRGELHLLAGEQDEKGLRPFGYRLRKSPADSIVVIVCRYDPTSDVSN